MVCRPTASADPRLINAVMEKWSSDPGVLHIVLFSCSCTERTVYVWRGGSVCESIFDIKNIAELTCVELISCQSFIKQVLQVLQGSPTDSGFHMDMVIFLIHHASGTTAVFVARTKMYILQTQKWPVYLLMIFSTTVGGVVSPCKATGGILSSAKVSLPNNAPLLGLFSGLRMQHC